MRPLVTPDEMAAAEMTAVDSGTPVEALMDRAGRAVARTAIRMMGGRYGKNVVVVCGKGNNGGDGFVAARVLRREGVTVRCLSVADVNEVQGAAKHHLELMVRRGVPIEPFDGVGLDGTDVIIDAVFGTGFHGSAEGPVAIAIAAINASDAPVISVDIPSGVDGLTGATTGPAIDATVTIAMAAEKIGTAVGSGAVHAGLVDVVDIGIPVQQGATSKASASDVAGLLVRRPVDSHKRSHGSVAILGGSTGMSGAVILAATGAMRAGAGYVTVGVTAGVQPMVAGAIPEALSRILTSEGFLGGEVLEEFKPVLERADALAVGPGLGQGQAQTELVHKVLSSVEMPVVLDADALNVLASDTSPLRRRTAPCIITPHPAELARLLDITVDEIQIDRVSAARRATEELGCVVVLKGFHSLIADGEQVVVNPTGGPSLATAGTGDVLTGVISAFLAGGLEPIDAAVAATYVHGLAGELAGEVGVIAGDVVEALPKAIDLVRQGAPQ